MTEPAQATAVPSQRHRSPATGRGFAALEHALASQHQAPTHRSKFVTGLVAHDHRHDLRRRDIVAGKAGGSLREDSTELLCRDTGMKRRTVRT
jgi:hypothetical protein